MAVIQESIEPENDSSLKLLVVPRDEDILQMAYQSSAYHAGSESYSGSALDIPEPPLCAASSTSPTTSAASQNSPRGSSRPDLPHVVTSRMAPIATLEGFPDDDRSPMSLESPSPSPGAHQSTHFTFDHTITVMPPPDSGFDHYSSPACTHVEDKETEDDREAKLVRRVSYLMATNRETQKLGHGGGHELSKSDSHLQPMPTSPLPMTPTKTSNIKKLKAFFGEKTPRIVEATTDRSRVYDMPPSGEANKEGILNCKISIMDGRRASDRSWRPAYVLLQGHALYLFKDKASATVSKQDCPSQCEEQPISIKASIVDIAYHYTKRQHVFRLTTYSGSEYLFQTDNQESMLEWIRAIQANNDPDDDEAAIANTELIVRKTSAYELKSNSSPQPAQKSLKEKKVSKTSLRSKSPVAHSPNSKPRKPGFDFESPAKGRDGRTWRGRMVKKFKRYGSSSSTGPNSISVEPESSECDAEFTGTFNIPLYACAFSEELMIPYVVEICTKIIEERGLENQGIYRVPGNTGAVNNLQAELDREPYNVDIESDKWLDVNVVSSLLKSFFRKLPESLISDDLYETMMDANRTEDPEKRMLRIKRVLHELPDINFETFRFMAGHLNKVAEMADLNKMYPRNLAIVFGPTLIRKTEESMVSMVKDMTDQCRIVESVLQHYDWFFESWDVDDHVPEDKGALEGLPVSGMNQELLSKAENMEAGARDVSAKELMTTFVSAATRKMKRREKTSKGSDSGSIDADSHSCPGPEPYQERNIDREIELRRLKEELAACSQTTVIKETVSVMSTSTIETANTQVTQANQFAVSKTPPNLRSLASTDTAAKAISRRYSEDVLDGWQGPGAGDPQHRPGPAAMTYSAQHHLRRIQAEKMRYFVEGTDKSRQEDEWRSRMEARGLGVSPKQSHQESVAEEFDSTSEYSASSASMQEPREHPRAGYDRPYRGNTGSSSLDSPMHVVPSPDYSSRVSPSCNDRISPTSSTHSQVLAGGRCFAVSASTASSHITPDAADFNTSRVAGKGTVSRKKTGQSKRHPEVHEDVERLKQAQRKGSLDSLREFYCHDASDERWRVGSQPPDDPLHTLTATFDEKLTGISDYPPGDVHHKRPAPTDAAGQHNKHTPSHTEPPRRFGELWSYQGGPESKTCNNDVGGTPKYHKSQHESNKENLGMPSHCSSSSSAASSSSSSPLRFSQPPHHTSVPVSPTPLSEHTAALRRSSERLLGGGERREPASKAYNEHSCSPVVVRRRDPTQARRIRRRHTVGGSDDPQHLKAIMLYLAGSGMACQGQSAWERLKAGAPPSPEERSLASWLEHTRSMQAGNLQRSHSGSADSLHYTDSAPSRRKTYGDLPYYQATPSSDQNIPTPYRMPQHPTPPYTSQTQHKQHRLTFESSI